VKGLGLVGRFALTLFVKGFIFQQWYRREGLITWQSHTSSWSRQPPKTNSYPQAGPQRRAAEPRISHRADLRWDQVDFKTATLHVRRVKQGTPSTHPILGDELRALRRLQREQDRSAFVFTSERGAPFGTAGFARMVERAGVEAKLGFKVHPHMLRHACGYALANRGHDTRALQAYLGHKNIQHTVRYTELSPTRFKNFWRE
jgi:integrase